ncbi:D-alanyl-D-alanine carboxypeptidase [Coprococcus catus]|uniref:D-alanyl-D-alanine carboxypeptidase family protein n=1 Tax=Coprococcus catus TaxID=116085 RepID=UPI0020972A95|nr:D-alanyl-D-alanine carboxypeptidase family protein [Coprococcus catus]MCO7147252.1 D-alanyl-D-alanine carboxypeptidase [Coprococcus catus]
MVALGIFCTLFILIQNPAAAAETGQQEEKEKLSLNARAAVLMDADSGRILYGKNETMVFPMASTTKIMTLIVALEHNEPDQIVMASAGASAMPEVRLGVHEGERYRMEDLYYAMMLESFNDAAMMIAEGTVGSVENFAELMNEKAISLGCTQTYFITPNGLDAADEKGVHSSTAEDMAKIMRYAIDNEDFLKITQTADYSFTDCDRKRSFEVHNKNVLLTMMDGVLSGKTGYTADAGYCYVCAVKKDDRTFIAALLGSGWPPHKGYKWSDVQTLLDYGDKNYRYQTIDISKGVPDRQVHVMKGEHDFAAVRAKQTNYRFLLSSEDKVHVESVLPGQLEAPVEAGQSVGSIRIFVNGDLTAENDYVTINKIDARCTWMERLLRK